MRVDLFDFELPEASIARFPAPERAHARLLVLEPGASGSPGALLDRHVIDLPDLIPAGALLVLNDTRVVPARLRGRKEASGGKVELLLVEAAGEGEDRSLGRAAAGPVGSFRALARASKPLRPGAELVFGAAGELRGKVVCAGASGGLWEISLSSCAGRPIAEELDRLGEVPLPPYLRRPADERDRERYQTVYARTPGAIAAPTAGLHLTPALLDELTRRGVRVATLTLHVGLGTFKPVEVDDLDAHPMHEEWMHVSPAVAEAVEDARARGAPIFAVGTTVVRALESAADPGRRGYVRPTTRRTRLLIQPGYSFRVVDGMLTNFHLPRSTLLALVSAFAGRERVLEAYRAAIARGYRFYSYGDAMLVMRRQDGSADET